MREKELGDSICEYERDRKALRESEYKVRKIEKETGGRKKEITRERNQK